MWDNFCARYEPTWTKSVALPIVCGSRSNATTHMRVYIEPHLRASQLQCKIFFNHTLKYDTLWCRNTILSYISIVHNVHTIPRYVILWNTYTFTMWQISSLLCGTLSHYCGAHYHYPHNCGAHYRVAHFHFIVGHNSKLLWGTLSQCGTSPHYCGSHQS